MKFFEKVKEIDYRFIKILGIKIYERYVDEDYVYSKILFGLFVKRKEIKIKRKELLVLGIRVYKSPIEEVLLKSIRSLHRDIKYLKVKHNMELAVAKQHSKVFPQFKHANEGKTVALIATGPTMNYFNPADDVVQIGVNKAFLRKDLDLKYWFAIDYFATKNLIEDLKSKDFYKFFGQCSSSNTDHIYVKVKEEPEYYCFPDSVIESVPNSFKFYIDHPSREVNRDIETQPLPDFSSCVFSALSFALYSGAKKIYIVGCDCAMNGYFDKTQQIACWNINNLIKSWDVVKDYLAIFHPEVEIVSVNPVGLKGYFKDVYTQSYLDANPDVAKELGNDIEILKG